MTKDEATNNFCASDCSCNKSEWDEYYVCIQHKSPRASFDTGWTQGQEEMMKMAEEKSVIPWEYKSRGLEEKWVRLSDLEAIKEELGK